MTSPGVAYVRLRDATGPGGGIMASQQRMIMKPSGLKKVLIALLLMCGLLVFYLFWSQEQQPTPMTVELSKVPIYENKRAPIISYSKTNPIWTWDCVNQKKCERRLFVEGAKRTSLATCNMLCGSPPFWPQPTGPITLGSRAIAFHRHQIVFPSKLPGAIGQLLEQAYSSFNNAITSLVPGDDDLVAAPAVAAANNKGNRFGGDIEKFVINVNVKRVSELKLKLSTDESYNLTLRLSGGNLVANLVAGTFFGARHGLETLSQLVWWDDYDDKSSSEGTLKILTTANVQDAPAFPYRGLMLDTSRHFFPLDYIRKMIVGMAANKLNAFHWHIADSQSFPFQAPSVPELSRYGAYGPDMIYTADDVKEVVSFAATKGIRVMIEVDTPAHSGNGWTWGPSKNMGDLAVCVNEQPWATYCGEPPCGQLNPQNPRIYDVLRELYKDILELTEEREFFHLGGDEVNLECWSHSLNMSQYTDLHDAWGDFTLKAMDSLAKANGGSHPPHVVIWSSNLSKRPFSAKYLDKSKVVVQIWGPVQWSDTTDLLSEGYRVIMSHVDAWYLDCGFGRWREYGDATCDPYRPWQSVYNHRPWQQRPASERKLILGAEACLWTEQVSPESLDSRLWPRASAFAERVWTDPLQTDQYSPSIKEEVYTRLGMQRERMVKRGFNAEAMWPQWCTQNPGMCL